jgi:hypothetical protein
LLENACAAAALGDVVWRMSGHAFGGTRSKRYRGSRRRIKRLTIRGNSSWEFWVLLGWIAFLLLVVMPWMIRQSH